jgi:putative transposase
MPILKAYKYRLEPNSSQRVAFEQYAGCCRFVWNWALDQRKQYYAATGESLSWAEQDAQLKYLKKQFPFLSDAPSQCLQQVIKDLDRAYKGFSREGRGFPKFKKKGVHDSFRLPQGFRVVGNYIRLPKVGEVKFRLSRELEGVAKNVTVSRRGGHWYVSVQVEAAKPSNIIPFGGAPVGIDLGVRTLATLSDGSGFHHPDFSALKRKRLQAQRALARKKKGSSNFKKAKARLSRIHEATSGMKISSGLTVVSGL